MTRLFAVLLYLLFFDAVAARETNGQRMARGLPPLPPRWMPTRTGGPTSASSRPSPSSVNLPTCRAGSAPLCCTSAVPASDSTAAFLLELLKAPHSTGPELVAITCAPLRRTCTHQVVCCDHDDFDGVIATGCHGVLGRA
ncbi:hypothetical protein B0H17DRAFT_1327972 [Mycena rosella]|uniref:Hydrophobin n=1 Tax=Mycena rosella TaxID=1033263 RepID=A0AAD7DWD2_MYCRO|nr:hypothetical protein B0H17DRAFT_1327972 [Mycena rosella]